MNKSTVKTNRILSKYGTNNDSLMTELIKHSKKLEIQLNENDKELSKIKIDMSSLVDYFKANNHESHMLKNESQHDYIRRCFMEIRKQLINKDLG